VSAPSLVIRPMQPADTVTVYHMEGPVFGRHRRLLPDLQDFLDHPEGRGLVAEVRSRRGRSLVGYALFRACAHHRCLQLDEVGVLPAWRRRRVGRALVGYVGKLAEAHGLAGFARVDERDLPAQLLLRGCGWRCTRIIPSDLDPEAVSYFFEYPHVREAKGGPVPE
jgi:GNAT superfamily N-acetyltransferase